MSATLFMTPKVHPKFVNEAGKAFSGFAFSNLGSAGVFLAMITADCVSKNLRNDSEKRMGYQTS